MRGDFFRCALIAFCLLVQATFGAASTKLEESRATVLTLLSKVEEGRDPCFSDNCQTQKFNLLGEIFRLSENIPGVGQSVLRNRDSGLQSGYKILSQAFHPLSASGYFPRTTREWVNYWKRRSSHDLSLKSQWMNFLSEVYSLNDGLQIYSKLATSSPETKELVQEAWNRGAAEISFLMIQTAVMIDHASQLQAQGREREANQFRKEAFSLSERRTKLEENFKGQLRPLLEGLIPQTSFKEIVSFFALLKTWTMKTNESQLFDPQVSKRLLARSKEVRALARLVQNFTDLEYGIVGLRNFYSQTNPLVRAEAEIPVQEFLDRVEGQAGLLIELGASYFLLKAGPLFFDSKFLATSVLPTAYNLLSIEKGVSLSSLILESSNRRSVLEQSLPGLEEQLEHRNQELFKTRKLLKAKLAEIDLQLSLLKQQEGENNP